MLGHHSLSLADRGGVMPSRIDAPLSHEALRLALPLTCISRPREFL